jgi:hypothetical protein
VGSSLLEEIQAHMAGREQFDDMSLVVFGRAAEAEPSAPAASD